MKYLSMLYTAFLLALALLLVTGCASPQIRLTSGHSEPLREHVLKGETDDKICLIPLRGTLSTSPQSGLLTSRPSVVQEFVSQLNKAAEDEHVKAVVIVVNSPGGTATASDILYNEILSFKKKTGCKVVVSMMEMAASGGYYASLAADVITAHPTTLTGSVGTIFIRPDVTELMSKIGVSVITYKSGENKDMAAFFTSPTAAEKSSFQQMITDLNTRFLNAVQTQRNLSTEQLEIVSKAGIFSASKALELGLIDKISYLPDAIEEARTMARIPDDASVIVYRRSTYHEDNIYNPITTSSGIQAKLIDLGSLAAPISLEPGFHHVWLPQSF